MNENCRGKASGSWRGVAALALGIAAGWAVLIGLYVGLVR